VLVVAFAVLAREDQDAISDCAGDCRLALSFVPGIPKCIESGSSVSGGVAAAVVQRSLKMSWRDFRDNFVEHFYAGSGAGGVYAVGVAFATPWVFKGFELAARNCVGRVLSTTDAIARRRLRATRLPSGLWTYSKRESGETTATGLVALAFAVALVVTGERPTVAQDFYD